MAGSNTRLYPPSKIRQFRFEKLADGSEWQKLPVNLVLELFKPTINVMGKSVRDSLNVVKFQMMKGQYKQALDRIVSMDNELKNYGDIKALEEAYKVMIKFAPSLASEPRVARAFLRAFIHNDGIISESHVKLLTEAEEKYNKSTGSK